MPNSLEAAMPRILAQGLVALRENTVMAKLVNTNFDVDARQKGSSVDVPIPSAMGDAEDVVPTVTQSAGYSITPTYVPIKLDKWKKKDFTMSDRDIAEVMEGYQNIQITEAARSLANAVDRDLLKLYTKVAGFAGVAGQTAFQREDATFGAHKGLNPARDARKVLNRQLTPIGDRRIVLDVDAEANATALPEFLSATDSGSTDTIEEAVIGRKLGFDWYMTQNTLSHNTFAAGTIVSSGSANVKDAKVLTVSGATVAPAEGDIFTIAGDFQSYVVGKDATLTSWPISPPLKQSVVANTAITVIGDHVVSLAFHRDAFALAVRPLLDVDPVGNRIESFTDDESGLTMRLEISRENKQTRFSFDILYGCAAIRPECACRILG
jgi:hypothetical protein